MVSRPIGSKKLSKRRAQNRKLGNVSSLDSHVSADHHLRVEAARKLQKPVKGSSVSAVSRDTTDWQVLKSIVLQAAEVKMPKNVLDVDVFTDGKGPLLGNSHCAEFYSETDSAFDHEWSGKCFLLNPPYSNDIILRTLQKVLRDFPANPTTSHYLVFLPDIKDAVWYPLVSYFEKYRVIAQGEVVYSCSGNGTYDKQDLKPAGKEGGPDRFFIQGTPWPVLILYKGPLTPSPVNVYTLAHMRFGHITSTSIAKMVRNGVNFGLKLTEDEVAAHLPSKGCAVCNISKTLQPSFDAGNQEYREVLEPFEYVVGDVTGPISPPSPSGMNYVLNLMCMKLKWKFTCSMARKLDITEAFLVFTRFVKSLGFSIKHMVYRSDAERIFLGGAFADYCKRFGISQQNSPPYLKQLNGASENVFRHMWPMVKSLLNGMQVPMKYWPHAVHHTTWLRNRLPDSSLGFKSPFELLYNYPPDLSEVRVFFSPVFSWIDPSNRTKLSNTAAAGVDGHM